jgi:stage V sporulation protein S
MEPLRVSTKSQPKSVAGAIAAMINEYQRAEVLAVGAGAVNQAIKAIAITRGFLAPRGIDIVVIPAFTNVDIDGVSRTSIKLLVEIR